MAVSAAWDRDVRECAITFNMPLQSPGGGFDLNVWRMTHDHGIVSPTAAAVTAPGNVITLTFGFGYTGVSQIAYNPPPFDVRAAQPNGLVAAAFVKAL